MIDSVNHPTHYQREGRKECKDEIREKYGNNIYCTFCLTNVYKYLYRAGLKENNSEEQDLQKALFYFREAEYYIDETTHDDNLYELFADIEYKLWNLKLID